jgi:hypothetical protein
LGAAQLKTSGQKDTDQMHPARLQDLVILETHYLRLGEAYSGKIRANKAESAEATMNFSGAGRTQ